MHEVFDTPWKLYNQIHRLAILPLVRLQFLFAQITWGKGWKVYGPMDLQIHRKSTVKIGDQLQVRNFRRSNPLTPTTPLTICTRNAYAVIEIGHHFSITGGSIIADNTIRIGNFVTVGANTIICDTDFHPLDPTDRGESPNVGKSAPIVIEDKVFIGMQCLVLKGVVIGKGSVIGAGSVVTRDVPPRVIVAGNPARIIREL